MPLAVRLSTCCPRRPTLARAAYERWRAVATVLESVENTPEVALAAAQIRLWLNLACDVSFESAAGLPSSWRSALRREMRDDLVHQIAARHYPGKTGRRLAGDMGNDLARYECAGWNRDRAAGRRPDGRAGDFYDLLLLGAVKSDRLRQLFNGLAG
jgi:hypothetical protein